MDSVFFSKKDVNNFLKRNNSIDGTDCIFVSNGDVLKFYRKYLLELKNMYISYDERDIDDYSLDKLISLRNSVKLSSLPKGKILIDGVTSGVVYDYFEGFNSFDKLCFENKDLILENLSSLVIKNIELMENGIFNTDLHLNNILYSSNRVELIDLDGPYIKFDPYYIYNVNEHLGECFIDVIRGNMLKKFSEHDVDLVIDELISLFNSRDLRSMYFGSEILEDIRELKLIL